MKKMKSIIKIFLQKVLKSPYIILYDYYKRRTSINPKQVLLLSDSRQDLSGNFQFIYDELKKNDEIVIKTCLKKSLRTKKSFQEIKYLCQEIAKS